MNIIYAMTLLEVNENKLIFHQPKIDLLNFRNIILAAFKENYKKNKSYIKLINLLYDDFLYLDLKYYLKKYTKDINSEHYIDFTLCDFSSYKKIKKTFNCSGSENNEVLFESYYNFTLEDLLINDIITDKPIKKSMLTSIGEIVDEESLNYICDMHGYCGITYIYDDMYTVGLEFHSKKVVECDILFKKILDYFPDNKNFSEKKFIDIIKKKLCSIDEVFLEDKSLNIRNNDFYLYSCSTYEYAYNNYLKLLDDISKDKYPNFEINKKIISDCVKKNIIKVSDTHEKKTTILRKNLGFPIFSEGIYSDDVSLLDLSDQVFKKSCCGKGIELIGTLLNNTKFIKCNFSECMFIAANLNDTVFENCYFSNTLFFKLEAKNTKFVDCSFYDVKFKNDMNETVFDGCHFDRLYFQNYKIREENNVYILNQYV